MNTDNVTRVEVIDDTGRAYTVYDASNVSIELQDDNKTLKVFLSGHCYRIKELEDQVAYKEMQLKMIEKAIEDMKNND